MKNRKGFVLVETIVTAVFVLGLFSFLVANVLPLVGDYDKERNYDSIESKYDVHLIRKMILKDNNVKVTNLFSLPSEGFYIFSGNEICAYLNNKNYCKLLLSRDYLDVYKIIVTDFNTKNLKKHASSLERSLKEYVKYMPNYDNTAYVDYDLQKRIIVMFNDGRIANAEILTNSAGGSTC